MADSIENGRETGATAPSAAKKLPCWVCGGDLLFNFVTLRDGRMSVHNYCPRCKRSRTLDLLVE